MKLFIWVAFVIGVFALNLRDNLDDFLDNLDNDELFEEADEYNEEDEYNLDDELDEEDDLDYEEDEEDYDDLDENEFELQQIDVQFPFSKEIEGNTPSSIFNSAERLLIELQVPAFAGLRPVY